MPKPVTNRSMAISLFQPLDLFVRDARHELVSLGAAKQRSARAG
jgi:hypothetical protein